MLVTTHITTEADDILWVRIDCWNKKHAQAITSVYEMDRSTPFVDDVF